MVIYDDLCKDHSFMYSNLISGHVSKLKPPYNLNFS